MLFTKNLDSEDFAMTSLNKQYLSHIKLFQPLKAIKGQIQFWTPLGQGTMNEWLLTLLTDIYIKVSVHLFSVTSKTCLYLM